MYVYIYFRYNKIEQFIPDAFTYLLEEIHKLETDLGHLPQKWKILWDQLELPNTDSLTVINFRLLLYRKYIHFEEKKTKRLFSRP